MKRIRVLTLLTLSTILFLLTSCAANGQNDELNPGTDGVAFDYMTTITIGDRYEVYEPNNYSDAIIYYVNSYDTTSTQNPWIINFENTTYFISSNDTVEPDNVISVFYDELVKNEDNLSAELGFDVTIYRNGESYQFEKLYENPNNNEIGYKTVVAYLPLLIKNTTQGYSHYVYVPVYIEIVFVDGNKITDPFTHELIMMDEFEALYILS